MTRKTDGGKGDGRRREDRAAVEANWPTNWNAREDGMRVLPEDSRGDSETVAEVQATPNSETWNDRSA